MSRVHGNRCEVVAESLDDAGLGVGASGAEVVHVADLLPGERAEVAIEHSSRQRPVAWGRVIRRLSEPSTDRVEPACPGFGRCGGCTWQHLAYPAQLAAKHRRVVEALADALAIAGATVAPVRPSPAIVGYRNKGKYVAGSAGDHLVLGAYAPRTHTVVDTLGCKVVAPIIDEVASWIRGAAQRAQLVAYDEATRAGELRYVIVREVAGDVLVVLVATSATSRSKLDRVAQALAKHSAVRGVVAIDNDRSDGAIVPAGATAQVLLGTGSLVDELAGARVEVGAGEFLQVNRAQARAMYARIVELAAGCTRAVELFAGLGGIGLSLARAGTSVVAVEIDRDAVAALRRSADDAKLPVVALAGDAANLPAAVRDRLGARPDLVVVNPPRKGLAPGARELVTDLGASSIIYVSCGPDALGKDLVALAASGYVADVIEPFDLMPGTSQVEVVVRLRRA